MRIFWRPRCDRVSSLSVGGRKGRAPPDKGAAPTAWAFPGVDCPEAGAAPLLVGAGFAAGVAAGLAAAGVVGAAFAALLPVGVGFAPGATAGLAAAEGLAVVFSDISGIGRLFADGVIVFYGFAYLIKKDNLAAIQHACNVTVLLDGGNLV